MFKFSGRKLEDKGITKWKVAILHRLYPPLTPL